MYVVVERSRKKILLSILGSVAFVLVSLAIAAQGSALALVVGTVGVVTFVGFGVLWVALGMRRGPGLIVDDDGFDDGTSALAVGRVPWADVTGVSDWTAFRSSTVVVHVRNPDAYLARLTWIARPAARANLAVVGSPVTMTSSSLDMDSESLSALLHEGFERHRRVRSGA